LLQKNEVSPWILHAGFADKILLDSPTALSSYETLEFINQKIRVVGSGIDDTIYETFTQRKAIKRRLLKKHKMPENKMLLICAFPPDQFSVYTPAFEHKTFENLCGSWFEELGKISNRFNILIKPHPRLGVKALKKFETDSIKILDTPTEQLLPLADLYVACVSTTIRWALALGIPVINYDCFRYDYGDFYDAKGVMEATSQSQFRGHLNFFTPENLKKMTEVAYKDKANWGLLDGKYETRLRHEIEETFTIAKLPNPTHLN